MYLTRKDWEEVKKALLNQIRGIAPPSRPPFVSVKIEEEDPTSGDVQSIDFCLTVHTKEGTKEKIVCYETFGTVEIDGVPGRTLRIRVPTK